MEPIKALTRLVLAFLIVVFALVIRIGTDVRCDLVKGRSDLLVVVIEVCSKCHKFCVRGGLAFLGSS